jgi:parvulin-like peptidyl-prolyl isomerase
MSAVLFSVLSLGIAESGLKAFARVGDSIINKDDVEREIRGRFEYAKLSKKEFSTLDPTFLSITVDRLIERRLLLLYGSENSLIKEDKVEKVIGDFINGMGGEVKAQERLKSAGVDWESWKANFKDDVRLMLITEAYTQRFWNPKKEEVEEFLEKNPSKVHDPERIKVSVIVINGDNPLSNDEKLLPFVKSLKENPDTFAEGAKKFSDGASGKFGGAQGYIARGAYDSSVEKVMYELKVGEVSDPIPYSGKKYIFKVEDHKGGKLNEDEKLKVAAEALKVQRSREELRKMLDNLRKKVKVEKFSS